MCIKTYFFKLKSLCEKTNPLFVVNAIKTFSHLSCNCQDTKGTLCSQIMVQFQINYYCCGL